MLAYVKDVIENKNEDKMIHDKFYHMSKQTLTTSLYARTLDVSSIKNVSKEEKAIYDYLEKQDIELLITMLEGSTCLVNAPDYRGLAIEAMLLDEQNSEERLVSLAHELGHYLDVKFNHHNNAMYFNNMYSYSNQHRNTMELVAWEYGWNVLEALGYKNKEYYLNVYTDCLNSYIHKIDVTKNAINNSSELVEKYEKLCKETYENVI